MLPTTKKFRPSTDKVMAIGFFWGGLYGVIHINLLAGDTKSDY
jgi:hypothetical protein